MLSQVTPYINVYLFIYYDISHKMYWWHIDITFKLKNVQTLFHPLNVTCSPCSVFGAVCACVLVAQIRRGYQKDHAKPLFLPVTGGQSFRPLNTLLLNQSPAIRRTTRRILGFHPAQFFHMLLLLLLLCLELLSLNALGANLPTYLVYGS